MLSDYWKKNYDKREAENWPKGNTYVNHWKSPTYMVNVESGTLRGGGQNMKRKIWDGVKPILEEWTGMELEPSSMYGIRMYTEGAGVYALSFLLHIIFSIQSLLTLLLTTLNIHIQFCHHTLIVSR
jgi:hypothetical protein